MGEVVSDVKSLVDDSLGVINQHKEKLKSKVGEVVNGDRSIDISRNVNVKLPHSSFNAGYEFHRGNSGNLGNHNNINFTRVKKTFDFEKCHGNSGSVVCIG